MACHSLGEYYIYSFFWKRYRQRDQSSYLQSSYYKN